MRGIVFMMALLLVGQIGVSAQPYLLVQTIPLEARSVALGKEVIIFLDDRGVGIYNGSITYLTYEENSRLIQSNEVFIQAGNSLKEFSKGLKEIAKCDKCTFYPYSRDLIAVYEDGFLKIIKNGSEVLRIKFPVRELSWSEDGSSLSILGYNKVALLDLSGIKWAKEIRTHLLDVEVEKDLVHVYMKGCNVYTFDERGILKWMEDLCGCCALGKLYSDSGYLYVLTSNMKLSILNSSTGKVIQEIPVKGYDVVAREGIILVRTGDGAVHVLADWSRAEVKGVSGGLLIKWSLPYWVKGRLRAIVDGESKEVEVGRITFIRTKGLGEHLVILKDSLGQNVSISVRTYPLVVNLGMDGEIEVDGEGNFSIEYEGRLLPLRGTVKVDTGFGPYYTVKIYNYGILVGEYSSANLKFFLIVAVLIFLSMVFCYRLFRPKKV